MDKRKEMMTRVREMVPQSHEQAVMVMVKKRSMLLTHQADFFVPALSMLHPEYLPEDQALHSKDVG